jgi:hypothetical protein
MTDKQKTQLSQELEKVFQEDGCLMHPLCAGGCGNCDVPEKVTLQIIPVIEKVFKTK